MTDDSDDDFQVGTFEHGELEFAVISAPIPDLGELDELTEAEREVVELVLGGLSNAEIAEARGVVERTVANQLSSVYRKLDVNSRAELVSSLLE